MAIDYSITKSYDMYFRDFYSIDRNASKSEQRASYKTNKLAKADSSAMTKISITLRKMDFSQDNGNDIFYTVKSFVNAALDNNPLWHERDLTNSSCERIMFPESCILTDYILSLTIKLMSNLVFYDENIERNLNLTNGLIMAERLMAELTRSGMGKQTAYGIVRRNAIKANKEGGLLGELILEEEDVQKYLTPEDVEKIMNPHTYIGSSKTIINELLEQSKEWFK